MLSKQIVDTVRLDFTNFLAIDETSKSQEFISERKQLIYKSPTLDKLGFYNSKEPENLQSAKALYIKYMLRQHKLIEGNTLYLHNKKGIHSDIIYFDFKHFYPEIFNQIANHIDESYFGKEVKSIARKNILIRKVDKISELSKRQKMTNIEDIAKNSFKPDINNKDEFKELLNNINLMPDEDFYDKADKGVAKIVRNAMVFGFGHQNKYAKNNNISALVMFYARKIMENIMLELKEKGIEPIYSHTDSFMCPLPNMNDIDIAIRTACGLVDQEYFGNTEILALGINNLGIKGKFENVMVLNKNSYIYTTIAPRGKRNLHLALSGVITMKTNALGINKKGEKISDILNENYQSIFENDTEFFRKMQNEEFLYSILKHRLSLDYQNNLEKLWYSNSNNELFKKAVIQTESFRTLQPLVAEVHNSK